MQNWTLKSIIEKARMILADKNFSIPDAIISATVSLKENESVHFFLRYEAGSTRDDEMLADSFFYAHGSNPEELFARFAFEIERIQLPKEPITDFPY